jgi:ketosteroid isomerase-like protein
MKVRFLALFLLFSCALQAQNDEQMLRQMVNDIVKGLSEVQKTKDASKLLAFYASDVKFTNIEIGINGKAKSVDLNFDGVSTLLSDAISDEGQSLKISGLNISKVAIQDETGVVNFVYDYELSVGGTVTSKGAESAIYTFKKTGNGWRIQHAYQVAVEMVQNRGACRCELYKGSSGYATKTIVPSGSEYITNLDNFTFKNTPSGKHITVGSKLFLWEGGTVKSVGSDGKVIKELGKATGDEEAVKLILEKSIYETNCSQVSIKK